MPLDEIAVRTQPPRLNPTKRKPYSFGVRLKLLEKDALWPPYSNTANQIAAC